MQHTRPLQDYPEFSVRRHTACIEYRVENWRIARDGSGRVLKGYGWSWVDTLVPLFVAFVWNKIASNGFYLVGTGLALLLYLHAKCTQVLWESVLAIPSLGVQLETHRGLSSIPLTVSRRFIPLVELQDFVINEGLRRWDVRYYLTAVQSDREGGFTLKVAYENIIPYFPVLLEVYRGVHDVMFEHEDD